MARKHCKSKIEKSISIDASEAESNLQVCTPIVRGPSEIRMDLRLELSVENVDAQIVADSLQLCHIVGDLFDRFYLLLQVVGLDEVAALSGKKKRG